MASLPPFSTRPPISDQPVERPPTLQLPEDPPIARPTLMDPLEQDLSSGFGSLASATIDGNVPTLTALRTGAKETLNLADVEQKISQSFDQRLGKFDKQMDESQRQGAVDQLVINNIQNDLSGASTWSGPLRNDQWQR